MKHEGHAGATGPTDERRESGRKASHRRSRSHSRSHHHKASHKKKKRKRRYSSASSSSVRSSSESSREERKIKKRERSKSRRKGKSKRRKSKSRKRSRRRSSISRSRSLSRSPSVRSRSDVPKEEGQLQQNIHHVLEPKKDSQEQQQKEKADKARNMVPMSREQYEAQQSIIREVYDPETGRTRLVRGTGEIIERIVSRDQHLSINKVATAGDGANYLRGISGAAASSGRGRNCKR